MLLMMRWLIVAMMIMLARGQLMADQASQAPCPYWIALQAQVVASPPLITLSWVSDPYAPAYTIYRKSIGAPSWGAPLASVPGTVNTYHDASVIAGVEYDYRVDKASSQDSRGFGGKGFLCAGINVPLVDDRGAVILIVDQAHSTSLANELATLQDDLVADGWTVIRHDIDLTSTATTVRSVKNLIMADYAADPLRVRAVYLFGHIPVPYSGDFTFHHTPGYDGAWPADCYYGDMDDSAWTDITVNDAGGGNRASHNIPGDGSFDQSLVPSPMELQVGRVDLSQLTKTYAPLTEDDLMRRYLHKEHAFRTKAFIMSHHAVIASPYGPPRTPTDATAFRAFPALVGLDNITTTLHPADVAGSAAYPGTALWTNIDFVASPSFFIANDPKSVFAAGLISGIGYWNVPENFMRAALGSPSNVLSFFWEGVPNWYLHYMSMGATLGECHRITLNHPTWEAPISEGGLLLATLLGDPTLRQEILAAPGNCTATANGNTITLGWTDSLDANVGYHVYRSPSASGPFVRLTSSPITGTSYSEVVPAGNYAYQVRAIALIPTSGGTYYDASPGALVAISITGANAPPTVMVAAAATPSVVSAGSTTTILSVFGADDGGEANLIYRWNAVNAPAPVTFSNNGSNAAKSTLATFTAPGTYVFTVTLMDPAGNTSTSSVTVPVTLSVVAPSIVSQPISRAVAAWTGYFLVSAIGTPPLSYQWYQGISGDTSSPITGATTATYTTPLLQPPQPVWPSFTGWCRVSNAAGSVDSQSATITNVFFSITGFTPSTGSTQGGTLLTITGSGLQSVAGFPLRVAVGGQLAKQVTLVNSTTITCITPANNQGSAAIEVCVGDQSFSPSPTFSYASAGIPISISAIMPASGPAVGGMAITISGHNFSAPATVTLGQNLATNITVVNSTTITCTTSGMIPGPVVAGVSCQGWTAAQTGLYTATAASLNIDQVLPPSGPLNGGNTLTVIGQGFIAGTLVTIGGVAATNIEVAGPSGLTCVVPAGAAGTVDIVITTGAQSTTSHGAYTYSALITGTSSGSSTGTSSGSSTGTSSGSSTGTSSGSSTGSSTTGGGSTSGTTSTTGGSSGTGGLTSTGTGSSSGSATTTGSTSGSGSSSGTTGGSSSTTGTTSSGSTSTTASGGGGSAATTTSGTSGTATQAAGSSGSSSATATTGPSAGSTSGTVALPDSGTSGHTGCGLGSGTVAMLSIAGLVLLRRGTPGSARNQVRTRKAKSHG